MLLKVSIASFKFLNRILMEFILHAAPENSSLTLWKKK